MRLISAGFLIVAALSDAAVVGLSAPQSARAASMPAGAAVQSKVSDQELKTFVKAYVEYQRIKQSYEPKLRTMKDEKIKQRIEREGNEKVRQALEKQGLTAQKYNQLFAAVNGDPQLRRKALDLIQAERQKS